MAELAKLNIYDQIDSNKRKTFFFILFFILFIVFLGWIMGFAFEDQLTFLVIASAIAIFSSVGSYYFSDKMVLAISGAKEIQKSDNPELYNIVDNLCIGAGLPGPKIYIIDDSAPNAFATGRDPRHAVVAVTTGLLQKMDKPELEAVIAHELSHIGNYDIRLMTIVAILAGTVVLLSDLFMRWSFFGGRGRQREGRNSGQAQLIIFVIAIVLAILSPIIAQLIKLAISRKREYLADAGSAMITRNPEALARALEKLTADTEPLEAANKATAHMYIINPLKEYEGSSRGWFAGMFMTHPPVEERVAALRAM
ncbi:zinc metalloprotease HtpX [Candidatus Saganbacteria bacterium CG08_land_8_20_14_0_20_45_16]|uniref:Protease HtpX homolog n=1 Tax=Candidatus Saganbacteria bacterium CG08_land_8_20_14_0_20_45_16 TaxID=2014293 RepID=A0A2H0XWA9_UNCSA|nr:MAG: zinc metalloprotease HtpX [Candidatus Saganbacteria bacterium CG08_land_8_20_14_0_20_45_16]